MRSFFFRGSETLADQMTTIFPFYSQMNLHKFLWFRQAASNVQHDRMAVSNSNNKHNTNTYSLSLEHIVCQMK